MSFLPAKVTKIFLLLSAIVISMSLPWWVSARPLRVVIDAGHGGRDSGAVRGNIREKDLALRVSLQVKELLNQQPSEFTPLLTRRDDSTISLAERAYFAKKNEADLFISVHLNSSSDHSAHGTEIYIQNQLAPKEEEMFLAKLENEAQQGNIDHDLSSHWFNSPQLSAEVASILDDMDRTERIKTSHKLALQLADSWRSRAVGRLRQIRQAPFFLTTNTLMPTALIELGFLTHPKEADRLRRDTYQHELAQNIFYGIKKFKELLDKP